MTRFTPHAQPLPPVVRTTEDGRRMMLLIREPRPEARAAGDLAYETGEPNPYRDPESAEFLNWEAGYRDARQRDS